MAAGASVGKIVVTVKSCEAEACVKNDASIPGLKLHKCPNCMGVRYCSSACQKQAWPTHKTYCLAFAAGVSRTDTYSMAYPTVSTLKTPCPSYEGSIGGVLNIAVYSALKSDYPVLSINKTHFRLVGGSVERVDAVLPSAERQNLRQLRVEEEASGRYTLSVLVVEVNVAPGCKGAGAVSSRFMELVPQVKSINNGWDSDPIHNEWLELLMHELIGTVPPTRDYLAATLMAINGSSPSATPVDQRRPEMGLRYRLCGSLVPHWVKRTYSAEVVADSERLGYGTPTKRGGNSGGGVGGGQL